MPTRVMLFDFGHVLAEQSGSDVAELIRLSGRDERTFWELWPVNRPEWDHGLVTANDYWRGVAVPGTTDEKIAAIAQLDIDSWVHPVYDEATLQVGRDLRAAGIEVGVLSNTSDIVGRSFEKQPELREICSAGFFISADNGTMKPDPAIYEWASAKLRNVFGEIETVFTDDKPANVARASTAADGRGIPDDWTGIRFESAQQLRAELSALSWLID